MKSLSAAHFAIACALVTAAQAQTIFPDVADAQLRSDGSISGAGAFANRIGEQNAPRGAAYVFQFLLPTLPTGEGFATADLRLQLFGKVGTPGDFSALGNIDFYGIGVRDTTTILTTDFYSGNAIDPTAYLIQQDFIVPSTPLRIDATTGYVNTSDGPDGGDERLASFLNLAYDGGANAGKYVFFRLSYDVDLPIPGGNNGYEVLTANAGPASEKPMISYTTAVVPEPATAVLGTISGLALLLARRRRP